MGLRNPLEQFDSVQRYQKYFDIYIMDKEDENLKFRDQCATQIAQAIIIANRNLIISNTTHNNYGAPPSSTTTEMMSKSLDNYLFELSKQMELIADFSYKFADAMLKSRLKSFT